MEIRIPYKFQYREYQKPIREFLRQGGKRGIVIWHRRAGKDKSFFNICVEEAIKNVGGYAYVFPTYAQGKKVIWDSIDKEGKKFIDHIPKELIASTNGTELKITLINGSFIQILGSDNIDSLRGISPKGIIFSEFAFQNPMAWDVMRPILAENGGWAIFNSTPSGKNHFFDLCKNVKGNDKWFYQILTVDDTGAVTKEYIQEERENGMMEEMIQQEYYCSFDVGAIGSYYADLITQAEQSGRITTIPKNYTPLDIYFDLGRNDSTSIWFKQNDGMFFNFIHYYELSGKHISHYFNYISDYVSRYNLTIGQVFFPHDSNQQRIDAEKTSLQQAQEYFGSHKVRYLERTKSTQKDIDKVREMIPKCRFDKDECKQGIRCLENYKKEWDDNKKVFKNEPLHDWASHGADAFRYFAVSDRPKEIEKPRSFVPDYSKTQFYKTY